MSSHGKWSNPGVPHKGWEVLDFEDLGRDDTETCQMCEFQTIRYVHVMQHHDYPYPLRCGCYCAGHMSEDYEGARRRESLARGVESRRVRWLSRKWKISSKGNAYLRADGFLITIYQEGMEWKACVADQYTGQTRFSRRTFLSKDQAKLAAFDAMVQWKPIWRREDEP
jgi:hypothetical protein